MTPTQIEAAVCWRRQGLGSGAGGEPRTGQGQTMTFVVNNCTLQIHRGDIQTRGHRPLRDDRVASGGNERSACLEK